MADTEARPVGPLTIKKSWIEKASMALSGKFEVVRCNYLDWYEFCIKRPKSGSVLCSVAGRGEFLEKPEKVAWMSQAERKRAVDVQKGLKCMLESQGVRFTVLLDGDNDAAKHAEEFAASLDLPADGGHRPSFVAMQVAGDPAGNHFSIYREHVFIEDKHKPNASLSERPGRRITGYLGAFEAIAGDWNSLIKRDNRLIVGA